MIDAIDIIKVEPLPGCRHGVEAPTALLKLRWQGTLPDAVQQRQLEERLAHALWFLERLAWKQSKYSHWRQCRPSMPLRSFPVDFLLEPSSDPVAGLLAAGITALQWGSLLPVTAGRVLRHEGQEIELAVPWWMPQILQGALQLTRRILLDGSAALLAGAAEADWRPGLETMLETMLGQRALDEDGFHMALLARQRGLPLARLDFGVVEIGHGTSRRRFLGSLHGGDAVASVQASNKLVIKRQLLRAGCRCRPIGW